MDKMTWLQNELLHLGKIKQAMDVNKLVDGKPREAALALLKKAKCIYNSGSPIGKFM